MLSSSLAQIFSAEKPALSEHVRAAPEPSCPAVPRGSAGGGAHAHAYAGDNPHREGLLDTPKRVIDAYEELYSGYRECPADVLERTFSEIGKYDDFVLVRDIAFNSHCEHHMMPFMGKAHIAYKPVDLVVGLSKLARLVDVYARRLQTQEHMTSQIATAIEEILESARRRGDARGRTHVYVGPRRGRSRARRPSPPSSPAASATTSTTRCASSPWCAGSTAEHRLLPQRQRPTAEVACLAPISREAAPLHEVRYSAPRRIPTTVMTVACSRGR